jgi:hypothetical protein
MERILIPAFLATGVAIATLSGCGSGDRAPVAKVESPQFGVETCR